MAAPCRFVLLAVLCGTIGLLACEVGALDALPTVANMTGLPPKDIEATALGSAFDPETGRLYIGGSGFISEV